MSETYIGPPAHFSSGDNEPVIRIVIHCTAPGMGYPEASGHDLAADTARYFQGQSSGGSAHHVHDIYESVRCAPDTMICWHAPPNRGSIGHEICGEVTYTREQWLSAEVWPAVVLCAEAVRKDLAKYGLPARKLSVQEVANEEHGVCGHVDVSQAFHQSDHTDPGPNFPWDRFMALLQGSATSTPVQPAPIQKKDLDMAVLVKSSGKPDVWITNGLSKRHVGSQLELKELIATGVVENKIHVISQGVIDELAKA